MSGNQPMSNHPEGPDMETVSPLSRFFFNKRIFGLLLTFLMLAAGIMAYQSMIKEALPDLALPQATIVTEWPGADPATIEKEITNKIERKVKSLKGLKRVRSASFDSFSVIAVEFRAETDLQESMQLLRAAVQTAEADLPKQAKKPKIQQVSVNDTPILTISLFGDVPIGLIGTVSENLKDLLKKVSGVKDVGLGGQRKDVIRVDLRPERLIALGISPNTIRQAINAENRDAPLDRFESENISVTMRLTGRFRTVEDLRNLPVARFQRNRVVTLGEVAFVRRDLEREKSLAFMSWKGSGFNRSVDISVIKSPGADTIKTVDEVKRTLAEREKRRDWPHGLKYTITSDQSNQIWAKLRDVFNNGWQAMLGVFIVLFFMLSWREALVAGLSIPLTCMGALAIIWVMGYTLNEMVIIGMVLALGLLVDVFILMMEGMHEGIFIEKLTFNQAAIKTVKTYALPAFAGQMTTILAMVPLFGIGGIDGKFVRVIPVTTIACLVVSYMVALLVDVPLSRFFLPESGAQHKMTFVDRLTERVSGALYKWSLKSTVRNKLIASIWVAGAVGLFVISGIAASYLPSGLYPKGDGRNLGITVELAPDSILSEARSAADDLGDVLKSKDYLESVVKFAGQKSPLSRNSIGESLTPEKGPHLVGFSCVFRPKKERDRLAYQYLDDLRADLEKVMRKYPGSRLVMTPETGGSTTEDPVQILINGDDMKKLRRVSIDVQEALGRIKGATDVRDNLGSTRPEVKFTPNRESLDFHGISLGDLAGQVRAFTANDEIGKFPVEGTGEDLNIVLGTKWPSRRDEGGGPTRLDEFAMIMAFKPNGDTVPLLSVLNAEMDEAPMAFTHVAGSRSVTVMCKTDNRTVNEILTDMQPILEDMKKDWPDGYGYRFIGEAESTAETYGDVGKMLIVAIFLVFALLALQFSSFSQPFIIMLSLPFALIGTLGGFFIGGIPFSFPAMIGIIALVGIVVNDAIVMIETMNKYLKSGMSIQVSAARGAADRLRPIISTTITTVVGLVPLALSSPMWMPLCAAIIFGLLAATLVSQLVIPCLYLLLTPKSAAVA